MARKYTVTEEEETPGFLVFLEVLLCIIVFPVGIIVGLAKLIGAGSKNNAQKQIQKVEQQRILEEQKKESEQYNSERLLQLTNLRNRGVISEREFQELRSEIMNKLMVDVNKRKMIEAKRVRQQEQGKKALKIIGIIYAILIIIAIIVYGN